jgi:hypothetical protein
MADTDALPTQEAVLSLMELIEHSVEAAEYFRDQFMQILKKNKATEQFQDLIAGIDVFVQNVKDQAALAKEPWAGEPISTPFGNREEREASVAMKEKGADLADTSVDIIFEIAPNSTMERGYAMADTGAPVNDDIQELMDKYVKAWIASNAVVRDQHIMYWATPLGEPKKGSKGEPLVVPPDELAALIQKPETGVKSFISKQPSPFPLKVEVVVVQDAPSAVPAA